MGDRILESPSASENEEETSHGPSEYTQPSDIASSTQTARASDGSSVSILRDLTHIRSALRRLCEEDLVILLTPVVAPIAQDAEHSSDPFEILGRVLESRHAKIRHVPYTRSGGITSTHVGFIKRGQVIIFCLVLEPEQEARLDLADIVLAVSENRPCIIIVCRTQAVKAPILPYPSLLDIEGYSQRALEAAANMMYGDLRSPSLQIDGFVKRESESPKAQCSVLNKKGPENCHDVK